MQANERLHELISDESLLERIEQITASMSCPKDFVCVRSGFDVLCKSRTIGAHNYLECLEDNPQRCRFAVGCGATHLCTCPMRLYISKNLDK